MRIVHVDLSSIAQVQKFVAALAPLHGEFELFTDDVILDAKSLMGIYRFDLSNPVKLKIYNDSPENMNAITPFVVGGMN